MAGVATDWERIESDYRAGILSLREMATEAGITEGAIRKRAKRDQWARDLGAKIKSRADELVRKASVRTPSTQLTPATEKQVIEANAAAITRVVLSHRTDIAGLREKARDYQSELDGCGEDLGKRVSILKMLTETQKTLIAAEREAFGMASGAALAEGDGNLSLKVTFGR